MPTLSACPRPSASPPAQTRVWSAGATNSSLDTGAKGLPADRGPAGWSAVLAVLEGLQPLRHGGLVVGRVVGVHHTLLCRLVQLLLGCGEGGGGRIGVPVLRGAVEALEVCLLYTSPSPRDGLLSRMPSSA